jgi:amino acid transporter
VNWTKYGTALVAVLWAYDGWMNFGNVAEEIRNPSRNIPLAALGGVLLIIALYVSANVAYYLIIPPDQMAKLKDRPLAAEFFERLLGPVGMAVASGIMMVSVLGALNGNVLVAPRLLFAMGADGLAPHRFRELHPKYRTPAFGTLAYMAWSILLIVLGGLLTQNRLPLVAGIDFNIPKDDTLFDILTDFAIVGVVTMGTLAVAAIFPLRSRDPGNDLPYRCIGYPVVPMLYVAVNAFVLYTMFAEDDQRFKAIVGIAFIAVGAAAYEIPFTSSKRSRDSSTTS